MNFSEAESYLFSLGNEVETMKLGLENISTVLTELGRPQDRYKKVQVAGTNGKGSVCAFVNAICREAGIRTGVFTSPHLISVRERIVIDGNEIGEEDFAKHATEVRGLAETLSADGKLGYIPTFFEQITAIALLAFAEAKVELAILETGLGGRYDATTAARAEIAAITRVDLDHQEYLGNTIEEIAAEKAAIIHDGSSVVIGRQSDAALKVILDRCAELRIEPNFRLYSEWNVTPDGPETYRVNTTRSVYENLKLGLSGRHQAENAETAVRIAQSLEHDCGFEIEDSHAVAAGLENARHPGRLERIGRFLLDGAHNPSGAEALAAYLDEFVHGPITMIFGAMKGKDVGRIAKILSPRADRLILTRPSNTRSLTGAELAEYLPPEFSRDHVVVTDSVEEALAAAGRAEMVLVTGSLYLVGEAKKLLNN